MSSPRMRWPRESWRTGTSSSGPRSRASAKRSRFAAWRSAWHAVHVAQQVEAVAQREVPPQLRPLPEHHADAAGPARCADRLGSRPSTRTRPAGRHEDAGEHLDRRGLPGAVRADVADHRPRARSRRSMPATAVTCSRRRRTPSGLAVHVEGLGQALHVDDRRRRSCQLPVLRWWRTASRHTARATSTARTATNGVIHAIASLARRAAARLVEHPGGREVGDEGQRARRR